MLFLCVCDLDQVISSKKYAYITTDSIDNTWEQERGRERNGEGSKNFLFSQAFSECYQAFNATAMFFNSTVFDGAIITRFYTVRVWDGLFNPW